MSRFYGYHYIAHYRADGSKLAPASAARPSARKDEDWDKGALLIIAIVAIPTVIVAAIALLTVM